MGKSPGGQRRIVSVSGKLTKDMIFKPTLKGNTLAEALIHKNTETMELLVN